MLAARKLALLAILATAATVLGASPASAQTEPLAHDQTPNVRVFQEVAGSDPACPSVTPATPPASGTFATAGGCRGHGFGISFTIVVHVFGIESTDSTCGIEIDIRLDLSGEGYLSHQEFTQGASGTCTRRACDQTEPGVPPPSGQSEGRPWRFHTHEDGPGAEAFTTLMCIQPRNSAGGARTHCEVTFQMTQPSLHRPRLTANDSPCHGIGGFRGELTLIINVEIGLGTSGENQAEQNVEIIHP